MEIFALLTSFPAVTALVSNNVFPNVLPNDPTVPAIVYRIISDVPLQRGVSTAGMHLMRLECNVLAETYLAADAVRDALLASLDGFVGNVAGVPIQDTEFCGRSDDFDHDAEYHVLTVQFKITY